MKIELTDEMREAYVDIFRRDGRDAGLKAVLAIVELGVEREASRLIRNAYERGQADERALTQLLGPLCSHVWVDGVGNEISTCQKCGAPE